MIKQKSLGVVVGRFQVPELHEAHKQLIAMAQLNHESYAIFIACTSVKGSTRDPLDYDTRAVMIKYQFPDAHIYPIDDNPSDDIWSRHLDGKIMSIAGKKKVLLYSGHKGFASHYYGRYPVKSIKEIDFYRGTEIREIQGKIVPVSKEGRCGIMYGIAHQYPRVYPTVDIAVLDGNLILLGIKRDQEGLRFPGGFVDPTDKTLEDAAKREVFEECGGIETANYEYVCSGIVDDWRYRNRDEKIMSTLFTCKYIFGPYHEATSKPDSEFTSLKLYSISIETCAKMAVTHRPFFMNLLKKRNTRYAEKPDYINR